MQTGRLSMKCDDYAGPERRLASRASLPTQAFVTSRHRKHVCRVVNISAGGMAVQLESLELLERKVKIEFFLPGIARWQKLDAQVVRAGRVGQCITWGLAFSAPDEHVTARLEGYVSGQCGG